MKSVPAIDIADSAAAIQNGAASEWWASQPEITGPSAKPRPNAMPISANDCARFSGAV